MRKTLIRTAIVRLLASALLIVGLSIVVARPAAALPQIWFAPLDNLYRDFLKSPGSSDFMELFQPDAAWQRAASKVQVFKIYTGYALKASPADLKMVVDNLRARHIDLAIETQILAPAGACGKGGIEGFSDNRRSEQAYQNILAAGGVIKYAAMDEPLYFGHVSKRGCQTPIADLAANAAKRVAHLKDLFPGIVIGDIEPINSFSAADLPTLLADWADAYAQATGQPLGFVHVDLDWNLGWRERLTAIQPILQKRHILLGIIYNGTGGTQSDADWTADLVRHASEVENAARIVPDQAILQSWFIHPRKVLPETAPDSFTAAILGYARDRTSIELGSAHGPVRGSIADVTGTPLPHMPVAVTLRAKTGPGYFAPVEVTGVVPAEAQKALLALRINTECSCAHDTDIALRKFHFDELGSPLDTTALYNKKGWSIVGNGSVQFLNDAAGPQLAIKASAAQREQINQQARFPVTPGGAYVFGFDLRASEASNGSGFAAIIFQGASGHEIERRVIPIRAADTAPVKTAVTDSKGGFTISGLDGPRSDASLIFKGDTAHAPSRTSFAP